MEETIYDDELEVVPVQNLWNGTSYIVGNEIFDSRQAAEAALERFNSMAFRVKFAGPHKAYEERDAADEFYKKQIPPPRSTNKGHKR